MTRPPDEPWDPNRESPETRRFEPSDETAAYGPTDEIPGQRAQGAGPGEPPPTAAQPGPYDAPQAYTAANYGAGYGGPGYGGPVPPGPPPPKNTGRTVGLALAALGALVVLALVGVLIARGGTDDGTDASAGADSSSATTSTTEREDTTTSTTTTTEDTTTTTTPTVAPGEVVYQLTGNGDVVGIRYLEQGSSTVVAAAGTPWSQAATVGGTSAEITAIVIRGPVTCNILRGEDLLASSTSRGGPLRCAATVN
ncbi:hypothetical protein VX037_14460 [Gordonia sp. Z-3]|jgi:hypothetical protein|uniref:hypothetical protein n=1 Tax=unclassified Gordonia (in: high G+C Gram-positive bacteria) TaxID=2657482 RepID=UPI000C5A7CF3|nr:MULTISPECIES: hypothetical protein [unclassified Gordonia (in: high G+C Gram-positive bacteria)]MAU81396.1 hypothetical protein [Gordonia sp. (in: high G+C Gram-positive bacteria)]MED5802235.1 hypothetical protein [Gordonia sp. Z-3]